MKAAAVAGYAPPQVLSGAQVVKGGEAMPAKAAMVQATPKKNPAVAVALMWAMGVALPRTVKTVRMEPLAAQAAERVPVTARQAQPLPAARAGMLRSPTSQGTTARFTSGAEVQETLLPAGSEWLVEVVMPR